MAIIETKHTMAAIEKIKKGLYLFMAVLSCFSMLVFSVYYVFLILANLSNTLYLVIYIVLFISVICSFITELVLRNKKDDSRKQMRIKLERRRLIGKIIKGFKYSAKIITVSIVIYEIFKNPEFQLSLLVNIISIAMLVLQLISEFIIHFVIKYIDYLKFAFEMDFDSSFVTKLFMRKELKDKALKKQVLELQGEEVYTKQELKIIQTLREDANKYVKEKKEKLDLSIKDSKAKIKELTSGKLSNKRQMKIISKYEKSKQEAAIVIDEPDKLDALLFKAEQMVEKLPTNLQFLKDILDFLSLINNYIKKKYTNISKVSIIAVIGVIIYFVSPFDIIPDVLPGIGYNDEAFVIGICLDTISDELDRFIQWRDNEKQ